MKALFVAIALLVSQSAYAQTDPREVLGQIAALAEKASAERVVYVPAGGDIAAALQGQCGAIVELEGGKVHDVIVTLPARPECRLVTTLRTRGVLPERRIQQSDAWQLATVRQVIIPDGSHYWKVEGIRVEPKANTYGAIRCGSADGHASIDAITHHVEFDRVLVDVPDAVQERRGIQLNCSDVTVRRSAVYGVKEVGADSQAIAGWDSPGRIVIDDNHLEAASEVILFGGAMPSMPGLMAADVTITNNDLTRPLAWRGKPWNIKNLLEIKAGRRFVIRGNRLSNNWEAAQSGYAVLFTARNEYGNCPWCAVEDIVFEENTLTNAASGINILAYDDGAPPAGRHPEPAQRITIRNNLMVLDAAAFGGEGRPFLLLSGPRDIVIDHNTIIANGGSLLTVDGAKVRGFVYTNNIAKHNAYGFIGTATAPGMPTLSAFFENPIVLKNVFAGAAGVTYPATNLTPSVSTFNGHFLSPTTGDYRLKATSSWRNAGTDGRDLGSNLEALPR